MLVLWIIFSLVIFSVIIIIHELGHFLAARKFWVKVEEFWLGLPPKAKKLFTDKKWTEYTLNWLPLGGFVRLKWENIPTFLVYNKAKKLLSRNELKTYLEEKKEIFDKHGEKIDLLTQESIAQAFEELKANDNLWVKPAWQQAIIMLGWIFMNFLLAFLIFFFLFLVWVKPMWINTILHTSTPSKLIPSYESAISDGLLIKKPGIVLNPIVWSLAEKSNITPGSILNEILACQWYDMWDFATCRDEHDTLSYTINTISDLQNALKELKNKTVTFVLNENFLENWEKTGWQYHEVILWDDGKIWAYIWDNIELNEKYKIRYWVFPAAKYALLETQSQIELTFRGLKTIVQKILKPSTPTERQEAIEQVSGPIGMVDFMSRSLDQGVIFLMIIWAIISINLWVFNLLPIPALDGGRFAIITLNGIIKTIFWKKIIGEHIEWLLHVGFFIFLIALSIIIAYNDISKIIS